MPRYICKSLKNFS